MYVFPGCFLPSSWVQRYQVSGLESMVYVFFASCSLCLLRTSSTSPIQSVEEWIPMPNHFFSGMSKIRPFFDSGNSFLFLYNPVICFCSFSFFFCLDVSFSFPWMVDSFRSFQQSRLQSISIVHIIFFHRPIFNVFGFFPQSFVMSCLYLLSPLYMYEALTKAVPSYCFLAHQCY